MRVCTDVHYREHEAVGAALVFGDWSDATPVDQHVVRTPNPGAYVPGRFYERELPTLLALVAALSSTPEVIIVDGYVWLGSDGERGLGAHLYDALEQRVPVVGVAKTPYQGSPFAQHLLRGLAKKPLYVTAAGLDSTAAATAVRAMHGEFRVPTLLSAVDRLCRTA